MQLRPGRDAVDLREETVAPGQLLSGGVFDVGKILLHDQKAPPERGQRVMDGVGAGRDVAERNRVVSGA